MGVNFHWSCNLAAVAGKHDFFQRPPVNSLSSWNPKVGGTSSESTISIIRLDDKRPTLVELGAPWRPWYPKSQVSQANHAEGNARSAPTSARMSMAVTWRVSVAFLGSWIYHHPMSIMSKQRGEGTLFQEMALSENPVPLNPSKSSNQS